MSDVEFPAGIYFNAPREGAPDFVIGSVLINTEEFSEWLAQKDSDRVNLDIKRSKNDKVYLQVNNWKPSNEKKADSPAKKPEADFVDDKIPF